MFTVIYSFDVKPSFVEHFKKGWKEITLLIFKHCGSHDSRLHHQSGCKFIAYAQWPDKGTWLNSPHKLPPEASDTIKVMNESCKEIETLYEMEVVDDLLKIK